jgi:hypothetical protein
VGRATGRRTRDWSAGIFAGYIVALLIARARRLPL